MNAMPKAQTTSFPKTAPKVKGLPFIGNSLQLLNDPLAYLVKLYHKYGSVFQIRMGTQDYTVLAGYEANQLLSRDANGAVNSEHLFSGFANDMGTDILVTALDGEPHRHVRKMMREGYSKTAIRQNLPKVINTMEEAIDSWQDGQLVPVLPTIRRIVTNQLGLITLNARADDFFDEIAVYLKTLMNVHALKVWHPIMLKHPAYHHAKQTLGQVSKRLVKEHLENPPAISGREPDLLDDLMRYTRPDGQPLTEGDLSALAIGPFFAGMDTLSSTLSFFIYALAKYPDVLMRVRTEVDEKLLDVGDFNAYRSLDVLHATTLEVLRMFPVTPFTPRTLIRDLEFGGYHIPADTEVMFAQTVTHFLPEHFEDPHTFNIDRFTEGRKPAPNTFAPYTLGSHTCLGAGLAEIQLMVNVAIWVKHLNFELTTPDYQVPIKTMPLPNTGNRFSVRITKR